MIHVSFDGKSGKIIASKPSKGWSVCRTGVDSYSLIYKKPSLVERILDFILPS